MRPLHIKLMIINKLFEANTEEANRLIERLSRLIYEPDVIKWIENNKADLNKFNINIK